MKRAKGIGIAVLILAAVVLITGVMGLTMESGKGPLGGLLVEAEHTEAAIRADKTLEKSAQTGSKRAASAFKAAGAADEDARAAAQAIAELNQGLSEGKTGDEKLDLLYAATSQAQTGIDGARSAATSLESLGDLIWGEEGATSAAMQGICEFVDAAELATNAMAVLSQTVSSQQQSEETSELINAAVGRAQTGIDNAKSATDALDASGNAILGDEGALNDALQGIYGSIDSVETALDDMNAIVSGMILDLYKENYDIAFKAVSTAEEALITAEDGIKAVYEECGMEGYNPEGWLLAAEIDSKNIADYTTAVSALNERAQALISQAEASQSAAEAAVEHIAQREGSDSYQPWERLLLILRSDVIGIMFTAVLLAAVGIVLAFFPNQFARAWDKNPVFSTTIALLVMFIIQTYALGFRFGSFAEWGANWGNNAFNLLRANTSVGMVALGMTLVVITGGIDLAVGSTLAGVGTVMMVLMDTSSRGVLIKFGITGIPAFVIGMAGGMLTGLLIGAFIGMVITKGKVPPFITTLGVMNIVRSVAQYFTKSYTPKIPVEFTAIANTVVFGQRLLPIVYWLVLAAIIYVVMKHTAFGRHVYAVGSNERTTRLSGINVDKVKMKVYMLMGLIVSIASITQLARLGNLDVASAGSGYELDAIAAVVVGGTSMAGGRGSVVGTVLGVLIIGIMNNLLVLLGVDSFLADAFKGAIVIFAVLMQRKEKQA